MPDRSPAPIVRGILAASLAAAALLAGSSGPLDLSAQEPSETTTDTTAAVRPPTPAPIDSLATEIREEEAAPPIGLIEFFGLRTMEEDSLRAALGLGPEPEEMPPAPVLERGSIPMLAARLARLPDVAEARFETVCCHRGNTILFIGIREAGREPRGDYWPAPEGSTALPAEIVDAYEGFIQALGDAVRAGQVGDDLSQGHSFVADSAARAFQLRFVELAAAHLDTLRDVLESSSDPAQRAVAAAVIGYAPDKGAVAPPLVRALRDPDPDVRNNAARSLAAIAVYAKRNPEADVDIPIAPLAEMLDSVVWTDRNKVLSLLTYLTPPRAEEALPVLRREAFPALAEMARWRSPGHALPALVLLGRMAGLSDEETLRAWQEGRTDEVIERARGES